MLETIVISSILFGFFLFLYLPIGWAVVQFCFKSDKPSSLSLFVPAISMFIIAAIVSAMVALGLPNVSVRWVLLICVVTSTLILALKSSLAFSRQMAAPLFICFIYYLLMVLSVSFPDGSHTNILPASSNALTGYPIDNLISYNVSRYFVERIDPQSLEVVPTWAFTDRGPLAGILHAAVNFILGISERAHWLGATAKLYFVYQAHMIFLNTLALFVLHQLVFKRFGRRTAHYSLLIAGTTPFVFLNTLFTWPKMFMAYFAVLGISLFFSKVYSSSKAEMCMVGFLFAMGFLAHDMMIFYCLSLGFAILFYWIRGVSFKRLGFIPLSFLCTISPWILYKSLYSLEKSRLLYLHLFCLSSEEVGEAGFFAVVKQYLERNEFFSIVSHRLYNVVFPFDVSRLGAELGGDSFFLYRLARASSALSPYQLIFALGFPASCAAAFGIRHLYRRADGKEFLKSFSMAFGALVPAAFLLACTETLNHIWVYPFLLLSVVPAAWLCSREGRASFFLPVIVSWNSLVLVFSVWFRKESSVYIDSEPTFILLQISLYLLFIAACFSGGSDDKSA